MRNLPAGASAVVVRGSILCLGLLPIRAGAAKQPSSVRFHNSCTSSLLLHFVPPGPGGVPALKAVIQPGSKDAQLTWPGHTFMLALEGSPTVQATVAVEGAGDVFCRSAGDATWSLWSSPAESLVCNATWEQPNPRYSGEAWDTFVRNGMAECRQSLRAHPEDASQFCDVEYTRWHYMQCKYDLTPDEFEKQYAPKYKQGVVAYQEQPSKLWNFTTVGHEVHDIPSGLLKELRAFWLGNRLDKSIPEPAQKFSPYLSGCQSNTWHLPVPPHLQSRIYEEVRPLVAKWSGVKEEDLNGTAIYGLRMYRQGSVLQLHVDRKETHVLSAILEVGHLGYGHPDSDVDRGEQWPLMIYDHNGTVHSEPSKAGQLILYESATCAHGRPASFPGREFTNVFVHFAPRGWPSAYKVPSERGRAEAAEL